MLLSEYFYQEIYMNKMKLKVKVIYVIEKNIDNA